MKWNQAVGTRGKHWAGHENGCAKEMLFLRKIDSGRAWFGELPALKAEIEDAVVKSRFGEMEGRNDLTAAPSLTP